MAGMLWADNPNAVKDGLCGTGNDVYRCLPAWRWNGSTNFHTNYGFTPGINSMLTGIASIMFGIASVMWSILLWIIKFATDTNIIHGLASSVNQVAGSLFSVISGSTNGGRNGALIGGLIFLIVGYSIFMAVRAGPGQAVRMAVRCFVPLALLFIMGNAALSSQNGTPAKMSPGWVAVTVNDSVQKIATMIPDTLSGLGTSASSTNGDPAPNCAGYQDALNNSFKADFALDPKYQEVVLSGATQIPVTVSDLWSASYLTAWEQSQFGSGETAGRVGCRYLELNTGVSPAAQNGIQSLVTDKYGGSGPPTPAATEGNPSVYGPFGSNTDAVTMAMTAWASCNWDGAWRWNTDFEQVVSNGASSHDGKVTDGHLSGACSSWWGSNTTPAWQNSTNDGGGPFGTAVDGQSMGDIAGETVNAPKAQTFFNSWNGNNGSSSFIFAFCSLLAAGAFLFALGGLAIGTVLAQLLLIVVLCALPLLLIVMAIPGNMGNRIAKESLKIGLGAAVSKIIFLLILGVLIDIISIMTGLVGTVGGTIGVLITALIPLAAFYLLHSLLKKIGLGGIMSIKGAVMTTAAITGQAAKSGSLTGPEQAMRQRFGAARARQGLKQGIDKLNPGRPGGARPPTSGARTAGGSSTMGGRLRGAVVSRPGRGSSSEGTLAGPGSRASQHIKGAYHGAVGALSRLPGGMYVTGKMSKAGAWTSGVMGKASSSLNSASKRAGDFRQRRIDQGREITHSIQGKLSDRWSSVKNWNSSNQARSRLIHKVHSSKIKYRFNSEKSASDLARNERRSDGGGG